MKINDWNPCYFDYKKNIWIFYEKKWYCNTNKVIHGNENEYNKCKDCQQNHKIAIED